MGVRCDDYVSSQCSRAEKRTKQSRAALCREAEEGEITGREETTEAEQHRGSHHTARDGSEEAGEWRREGAKERRGEKREQKRGEERERRRREEKGVEERRREEYMTE